MVILKGNEVIRKDEIEDPMKKQLLTEAKKKGMQHLVRFDSQIKLDDITMAHFKPDRPGSDLWDKEPSNSLEKLLIDSRLILLNKIAEEDIDSEMAQEDAYYKDGKATKFFGTRYERNPLNRAKAIEVHGLSCKVCEFNFEEVYGDWGKEFIEVHHIKPLFTKSEEAEIDPENDLVPVCSNCHRMIHRVKDNVLSIEELKQTIKINKCQQH